MRVKLSLVLLLFTFAYAGSQTTASAQCAVCSVIEFCFECTQGPEGGTSCFTTGCFRCRTTGTCGPQFATTISPNVSLKVDEDTIRKVATRSPQLASILSDLAQANTLEENYTFHLANVQVGPEDLEWWLNPTAESSASFTKLMREAKRSQGKASLVFDVSFEADPDSTLGRLIIQLRNRSASNSSASLLQVTLIETTDGELMDRILGSAQDYDLRIPEITAQPNADSDKHWTVLSWQVS